MLTKSRLQYLQSLKIKKFRQRYRQFMLEGEKAVKELIESAYDVEEIFVVGEFTIHFNGITTPISTKEMERISEHKAPPGIVALVNMPAEQEIAIPTHGKHLLLDNIQDPGNLGTIIRIADWYGLDAVYCTENCVDLYNSKTLNATMGSFCHLPIYYANIETLLNNTNIPILAATLNGSSVYEIEVEADWLLWIGNESNGINESLLHLAKTALKIPEKGKAESLNAAVACGIIVDNLMRKP